MTIRALYNPSNSKVSYTSLDKMAQVFAKIPCTFVSGDDYIITIEGLEHCGCSNTPTESFCEGTTQGVLVGDWDDFVNSKFTWSVGDPAQHIPVPSDLSLEFYSNVQVNPPFDCGGKGLCLSYESSELELIMSFQFSADHLTVEGTLDTPSGLANFFRIVKSCLTGEVIEINTCPTGSFPWFTGGDLDVKDPNE